MIVYIDRSTIRTRELLMLEAKIEGLVAFVAYHEPKLVSYGFHVDSARSQMTVIAIHRDAASMEFHAEATASQLLRFADLITLTSIEIFGEPSEKALRQAMEKARLLGGAEATVSVHPLTSGFSRLPGNISVPSPYS